MLLVQGPYFHLADILFTCILVLHPVSKLTPNEPIKRARPGNFFLEALYFIHICLPVRIGKYLGRSAALDISACLGAGPPPCFALRIGRLVA